jgi:hypothetical protein
MADRRISESELATIMDREAGRRRGIEWYLRSASLSQTERLVRHSPQTYGLSECGNEYEAIAAVVRIIMPTQATDEESIGRCWQTLRGSHDIGVNRLTFVAGFLQGAQETARKHCFSLVNEEAWIRKLSPEQIVNLVDFACNCADQVENNQFVYPGNCPDAYHLCYLATHGSLPSMTPRELHQHVRAWLLDTLETDSPGCLIDACVERFVLDLLLFAGHDCCAEVFVNAEEAVRAKGSR